MKKALLIGFLVIPLLANADAFPKRKPGLWELSISTTGAPAQVVKQCTDEATDSKLLQGGNDMAAKAGVTCAKNESRMEGNNFISESECEMRGTKVSSTSNFSGDFNSQYTGETSVKYDPPLMGMTASASKITAKWIGACEETQKPGDIIMPGGFTMNVNTMSMGGQIPKIPMTK